MEIQQQPHGAVTVVRPIGPVSGDDAAQLRATLLDVRQKSLGRLVLDAGAVPFIDSAGLEMLLDVNEQLASGGQALKLSGLNEVLREVLDLTDLRSSFEQFEDVNAAVRSFL